MTRLSWIILSVLIACITYLAVQSTLIELNVVETPVNRLEGNK